MTRAEMLARMSGDELLDWMAFDLLEPIGEPRADWRSALLASLLVNINRDPAKTPVPVGPEDFMPFAAGPLAPPSPEERTRIRARQEREHYLRRHRERGRRDQGSD